MRSNCVLKLYVSGASPSSQRAIRNLAELCAVAIPGDYEVSVVDVTQVPLGAESPKIIWTPTLHKVYPLPERRLVGDLSDHATVLRALDLPNLLLPSFATASATRRPRAARRHSALLLSRDVRAVPGLDEVGRTFALARASSVHEAQALLQEEPVDVLLADWSFCTSAADDPAAALRALRGKRPVVVLADAGGERAALRALQGGAEDVVPRDAAGDELVLSLKKAIARHGARDQFRALLDASPDGMLILDGEGTVLYANAPASELLVLSSSGLVGQPLRVSRGPDGAIATRSGRFVESRSSVVEWHGRACDLICIRDVTGHVRQRQTSVEELTSLRETNAQLSKEATHDSLTGVLNRRGLSKIIPEEASRAKRTRMALSALLVDCDNFKGINDSLGHSVGDLALRVVADVASRALRPQDRLARIGGDEFLVLLPGTRGVEASMVGERLLRLLAAHDLPEPLRGRGLTVSVGAAEIPADVETVEEVVAAVSPGLKMAKTHGKRRVSLAADGMERSAPSANARKAMEGIEPHYLRVVSQRILRLSDEVPVGSELLVRGPVGELEPPEMLFELARTLGVSADFDVRCVRATLAARGCVAPNTRRHVNVLAETVAGSTLPELLSRATRAGDAAPVCVEISCGEILGNPAALSDARAALRTAGVAFALDDAQFERNTLEYLIVLVPDFVKVSRRMVTRAVKEAGTARDLARLAQAAHRLGAAVIAVGVESRETVELLRGLGIQFGQGFLWDQPTEAREACAPVSPA